MLKSHAAQEFASAVAALGHVNFLPWIEAEFGMSEQTARDMMHVAEQFGSNPKRVLDLTPKALYLLAAPYGCLAHYPGMMAARNAAKPARHPATNQPPASEKSDFVAVRSDSVPPFLALKIKKAARTAQTATARSNTKRSQHFIVECPT